VAGGRCNHIESRTPKQSGGYWKQRWGGTGKPAAGAINNLTAHKKEADDIGGEQYHPDQQRSLAKKPLKR